MAFPPLAASFMYNVTHLESFPSFLCYVVFLLLVPLWKKIVPLMNLKKVMIVYNIICVLLSIACSWYLFYGAYVAGNMYEYIENAEMKLGLMLYTLSKNVELLDTVFMVLRHKWGQISYLHMFHHSSILILGNYSYSYVPIPPVCIPLGINSLVHVYLYWYYAQTAMFGSVSLVWKKALTQFQIIQFLFDIVFTVYGYVYYTVCKYAIMYATSMLVLFSNFYYMAYLRKRPSDTPKKVE